MTADMNIFNQVDDSQVSNLDQLSNFEVAAIFNKYAQHNLRGNEVVNGGRGNPNWIATTARLAYSRLLEFGVTEAERTYFDPRGMAGDVQKEGIYQRLMIALKSSRRDIFLRTVIDAAISQLAIKDKDAFVYELVDGALGDHYPYPPRCLTYTEKVLQRYLQKVCFKDVQMAQDVDIFPTEGGTAAMVYIFQELHYAHVLYPGDTVVVNSSIFTPYLQIPELSEYNLRIKTVTTKRENNWQMTDEQFEQLKDPRVKAFFAVNPTNPTARAFTPERLAKFKEVIKANPDLVIITDDVYGTFSPSYQSIFAVAPHNTILVYSFSKLYGATGQRLGVVCMHHQNVCDRIIQENLQNRRLRELDERRYSIVVPDPHKMKFIDRMVADSRAIGLYHTAGLSSPQQVMMDMFALSNLKDAGLSPYVQLSREVVAARYHEFWHGLGIQPDETPENTRYYTLVDIFDLMRQRHGKEFCQYFKDNYNYLDFTYRLATEFGAVVMDATAFGAEKGNVRVSLANLEKADYRKLARAILDLVDEYYQVFKKKNKK
ncbi:MAG TPA: bifunctional aspartate transaminase/aspartate 4-decarboxylase [Limosilactobacillus oris]|uniref:bifunctional aspartate transaminase/aspartate 4-decarboxylase n=1 Tax=Limosilactobacillus oris TaxID=1632 RepID=UPI001D60BDA4|nr:bifunctional aspartate transaminase/aspartate 4-decarboxylase [Limosilactobacillus oris]HJF46389.1 bifunctional aspartate transaminase/aspartate 4-decarboxylase [Limosilactobacillus oris]